MPYFSRPPNITGFLPQHYQQPPASTFSNFLINIDGRIESDEDDAVVRNAEPPVFTRQASSFAEQQLGLSSATQRRNRLPHFSSSDDSVADTQARVDEEPNGDVQ